MIAFIISIVAWLLSGLAAYLIVRLDSLCWGGWNWTPDGTKRVALFLGCLGSVGLALAVILFLPGRHK